MKRAFACIPPSQMYHSTSPVQPPSHAALPCSNLCCHQPAHTVRRTTDVTEMAAPCRKPPQPTVAICTLLVTAEQIAAEPQSCICVTEIVPWLHGWLAWARQMNAWNKTNAVQPMHRASCELLATCGVNLSSVVVSDEYLIAHKSDTAAFSTRLHCTALYNPLPTIIHLQPIKKSSHPDLFPPISLTVRGYY